MAKEKRSLMTLDEVKEKVSPINYTKTEVVDFTSKKNRFEYDGENFQLISDKKEKRIGAGGIKHLVNVLDLPAALPKKLSSDPELMLHVINERSTKNSGNIRVLSKGNSALSFIDGDQTLISSDEIIDNVGKVLKGPMFDKVTIGQDGNITYNIVATKNKPFVAKKGDNFVGGVRISNNPLQCASTKIESLLERLVCLNGIIAPRAVWSSPKTIEGDTDEWVQENVTHAYNNSKNMFQSILKLVNKKDKLMIDSNLMDFLENVYDQLKIPETVCDLITRRIVKKGADSMYDIFNHITYVASNYKSVRENDRLSAKLMEIGGEFAQNIEDLCNTCNRPKFTVEA